MSEHISPSDFLEVMSESFNRGQDVVFTPTGTSMLPMLDGMSDTVTLSQPPERLNKYDVALYKRRGTGQLVLHRMVGFDKNGGYIFSGDNQYYYEYGVEDRDILALMTSFTQNGKRRVTTDFSYRIYIQRMILKKRIRILLSKIYRKLRG